MATKKCPFCAEEIQEEAIKCKHCGEMLTSGPTSNEASTVDVDPATQPTEQFQLGEVVEFTSMMIFANCLGCVRGIINNNGIPVLGSDPDDLNKDARELLLEFIALSLHLADRIAFNIIGSEKRNLFIDELLSSVSSNLAESLLKKDVRAEAKQFFQNKFLLLYSQRSEFYAPLRLGIGEKPPLEGTLFWEAAKDVADAYFPDDSAWMILYPIFRQCTHGVKDLDVRLTGVRDL